MSELRSADGTYLCVQQDDVTSDDAHGNFVVYGPAGAVWDRRSHEAGAVPAPSETVDSGHHPEPAPPSPPAMPVPPAGGGGARLFRVTTDGGMVNRMYSYWSNAWLGHHAIHVFAGHVDGRPRFFRVDRASGTVETMAWWVPYTGTTEGWFYDAQGRITVIDGPRLRRIDPPIGEDEILFDISDSHPGCHLWQAHSSDDGQTHCATVQRIVADGPYPKLGTVVYWRGRQDFYPAHGTLDESQVTPDGAFLVIKEDDDNRIINLYTRETRLLRDADGAVGHSDVGPGILVGEDNIHGCCVRWDLRKPLTAGNRLELFKTWAMGYVSIRGGRCLHSGDTHLSLVALDGSGSTRLFEHGGGSDYDSRVKANLSPCGGVVTYIVNGDVFVAELP